MVLGFPYERSNPSDRGSGRKFLREGREDRLKSRILTTECLVSPSVVPGPPTQLHDYEGLSSVGREHGRRGGRFGPGSKRKLDVLEENR